MNTPHDSNAASSTSNLYERSTNFSCNSGRPAFGSLSSLSRPRLTKTRRPKAVDPVRQIPPPKSEMIDYGVNPFRVHSSSEYQNATGSFVFRASKDTSNLLAQFNCTDELTDGVSQVRINCLEPGNVKDRTCSFDAGVSTGMNPSENLKKSRYMGKKVLQNATFHGGRIMGIQSRMRNLNINPSLDQKGCSPFQGDARSIPRTANVSVANESSPSELPYKFQMMRMNCKEPDDAKSNRKHGFVCTSREESMGFSAARMPAVFPQGDNKLRHTPDAGYDRPTINYLFNREEAVLSNDMSNLKIKNGDVTSSREHVATTCCQEAEKKGNYSNQSNGSFAKSNEVIAAEAGVCTNKVTGLSEDASSACFHSQDSSVVPGAGCMSSPRNNFEFFSRLDGLNKPVEFCAKKDDGGIYVAKNRRRRLKRFDFIQKKEDNFKRSHFQSDPECSESRSPMDVSPCPEVSTVTSKGKPSLTPYTSFHIGVRKEEAYPCATASKSFVEEDLVECTKNLNINPGELNCGKELENHYEDGISNDSHVEAPPVEYSSGAESESFKSANEQVDSISETTFATAESEISVSSRLERHGSDNSVHSFSSSKGIDSSFTFIASSSPQSRLSATIRRCKKNRMKVDDTSSSLESSSLFRPSSNMACSGRQREDDSSFSRNFGNCHVNNELGIKKVPVSDSTAGPAAPVACDKWRMRGNQFYESGDFSGAEDCYTNGVKCVPPNEISRNTLRALMLCYSNRAATRMALGRISDALADCKMAASLDPSFMRVQVRAANCCLILGEVETAMQYFQKCLSGNCVDRKITIEASEGLKKAQKVFDCMSRCLDLLHHGTPSVAENALSIIGDALLISSFSGRLLEMKAKALLMLHKFDEVIHLCNQTLSSARKNSILSRDDGNLANEGNLQPQKTSDFWIWCYRISFESYFRMGKFEEALEFIVMHDGWGREGTKLEDSIPLVATVRELLCHKASGNEAFQSGKYAEAVQHYTAAISCNIESLPFAAICFCNRAAAYKALGQIVDAIADCSLAVALDNNYHKALLRRASLFEMIRNYEQAAMDLEKYVSLLEKQVMDQKNSAGTRDAKKSYSDDLRQAKQHLHKMEQEARKDISLDIHLILGVEKSATDKDVRKAYHKAALRHHPDKACQSLGRGESGDHGSRKEIAEAFQKDADKLFKIIAEAYAVLSDASKRAEHLMEDEAREARTKCDVHNTPSYAYERSNVDRRWRDVWKWYDNRHSEAYRPTRYY